MLDLGDGGAFAVDGPTSDGVPLLFGYRRRFSVSIVLLAEVWPLMMTASAGIFTRLTRKMFAALERVDGTLRAAIVVQQMSRIRHQSGQFLEGHRHR